MKFFSSKWKNSLEFEIWMITDINIKAETESAAPYEIWNMQLIKLKVVITSCSLLA